MPNIHTSLANKSRAKSRTDSRQKMDGYALTAFSQRDGNIAKQRRAATRDVQSALDNNPNLAGKGDQFQFAFMVEEVAEIVTEAIEESPVKPMELPHARRGSAEAMHRKPR